MRVAYTLLIAHVAAVVFGLVGMLIALRHPEWWSGSGFGEMLFSFGMATPSRRIVLLAYPGVQTLDVTGPADVFAAASQLAPPGAGYTVELAARTRAPLRTSSGIALLPQRTLAEITGPIDTLLVAGGRGVYEAARDRGVVSWVRRAAPRCRRVTSVCTGAVLLAEAGLLDGRRATTHWAWAEQLAERYPAVHGYPLRPP